MAKIINLTPHPVNIIENGELVLSIAPSGKVARLVEHERTDSWNVNGIRTVKKFYGDVQVIDREDFLKKSPHPEIHPFPEKERDVYYIVPMLVGQVMADAPFYRDDLLGPDFGIGGVRTSDGSLSGAVGFIHY